MLADTDEPQPAVPRWQRVLWWCALLGYVAVLLTATHLPRPPIQHLPVRNDKVLHFLAYFVFGLLLGMRTIRTWRKAVFFLAIIQTFAMFDELTQPFFRRTTDIFDWLSDGVGGACGILAGMLLHSLLRQIAGQFSLLLRRIASRSATKSAESLT